MKSNRILNDEQDEFLRSNAIGTGNQDLANLLNQKFNLSLTANQMKSYKKNHQISSGLTGQFEKGSIPANKGKRFPGKINSGCFKSGHVPSNKSPIGSEILKSDGYVWVKTSEPNKWKQKHVLIWEEKYGKRPLDHVIVFADQNRLNFDLENLILISKKELLICNRKKLIVPDQQISKSGIMLSKVMAKIYQRKKDIAKI